jgi:NSS family neurotransmitter:Na+ symporter
MFVTLPKVFESMAGGSIIGTLFFVLVLFAALTSSISLMETVVSIVKDKTGLSRNKTLIIVLVGSIILGALSALGYGTLADIKIIGMAFLDFFDFISNSVLMPIVAFLTCIFVGYIVKPDIFVEEIELTGKFKRKKLFLIVIKYFAPICIVLILISSVLDALGIVKI